MGKMPWLRLVIGEDECKMSQNGLINGIFFVLDMIIAFVAYKYCFAKIIKAKQEIAQTLHDLEQFGQGDYDTRFQDICIVIQKNILLKDIWNDFKKSLTRHVDENGKQCLYSSNDAGEYFRFSTVTQNMSFSYWQNFGGIFTGIGILGTFFGLMLGLEGVDLSSSDVTVLREGIGNLLNGISVAFGTSLIGIIFALGYGIVHHIHVSKLQDMIVRLAQQIEDMYPRITVEQWLSDSYSEGQEQTRTLKNLSEDIAQQLGEVLDAQLSTSFDELCGKLDNQIKPVFEKLYDAIIALNNGGVTAIAGAVSEKAGAQLDSFAGVLQDIQVTMQNSVISSQQMTENANKLLINTMEKMGNSLSEGAEVAAQKQQNVTEQMAKHIEQVVTALNDSSRKVMGDLALASSDAQEQLKESIGNTKITTDAIISGMKEMSDKQSLMLKESADNAQKKMDDTILLLRNTIEKHNSSIEQSYSKINDMTGMLDGLLSEINNSGVVIKDTVQPLREATICLQEELGRVENENKNIHLLIENQMKEYAINGSQTEKNIQALMETLEKSEKRTAEAWNQYESNFGNISGELAEITSTITERLSDYNKVMNDGMKNQLAAFDKSMGNATTHLASIIEELGEIMEDFAGKNNDIRG